VSAAGWTALIDKAKLRAGQRVFITGCLGGAGRTAVQIAKMRGAEIAGSCSAAQRDEALALGVREIVDYRAFDANTYRGRFDVVFDTHGALSPKQCGAMLKRGGVALHLVPTPLKIIWSMLSSRHRTIFARVTPQLLASTVSAVEEGKLAPMISRTVPLSEAIPAIIELEKTGFPRGKLVVMANV
jgi:NADPH:quinone reductase-like Zn-dependent oxidoreductase